MCWVSSRKEEISTVWGLGGLLGNTGVWEGLEGQLDPEMRGTKFQAKGGLWEKLLKCKPEMHILREVLLHKLNASWKQFIADGFMKTLNRKTT